MQLCAVRLDYGRTVAIVHFKNHIYIALPHGLYESIQLLVIVS